MGSLSQNSFPNALAYQQLNVTNNLIGGGGTTSVWLSPLFTNQNISNVLIDLTMTAAPATPMRVRFSIIDCAPTIHGTSATNTQCSGSCDLIAVPGINNAYSCLVNLGKNQSFSPESILYQDTSLVGLIDASGKAAPNMNPYYTINASAPAYIPNIFRILIQNMETAGTFSFKFINVFFGK